MFDDHLGRRRHGRGSTGRAHRERTNLGRHRTVARILIEDGSERRVLLLEKHLQRGVDLVEILLRRLRGVRQHALAEHHQHGHGTLGIRGHDDGHGNIDIDERVGRVIHVADEFFGDYRSESDVLAVSNDDFPRDAGDILRQAAVHFAFHVFHDLRPSLGPPHRCGGDFLPVRERERIGQIRIGVRERLVVVRMVGSFFVAAWPFAQFLDAQLIHHVLVVLLGGERDGRRIVRLLRARWRDEQSRERRENCEPTGKEFYGPTHRESPHTRNASCGSKLAHARSGGASFQGVERRNTALAFSSAAISWKKSRTSSRCCAGTRMSVIS